MIVVLPDVLSADETAHLRAELARARWLDGRATAAGAAAEVKANEQLAESDPLRGQLAQSVLSALARSADFTSAALPLRVYPPGFNRYRVGGAYGEHVDAVLRTSPGALGCIRCDLSGTLFLSAPEEYDGGELVVRGPSATHEAKLPAGSLFLYPSTTIHEVRPVTRGERLACFFWVQSAVRDHDHRRHLLELEDLANRALTGMPADRAGLDLLTLRNELLQRWSET